MGKRKREEADGSVWSRATALELLSLVRGNFADPSPNLADNFLGTGNPLALLQNYRTSVLAALPALESFDGKSIPQDKSKYEGERPPTRATEPGGQLAEEHALEEPVVVDMKVSVDKITPVLVEGDLPPEPDEEEIARREKAKKDKGKKGAVEEEPELPKVTFHIEYELLGHMAFVTDSLIAGEPPEEEEEEVVEKPKKDNPKDKKGKGKKEKEPPPPPPEDVVPKKWPDHKFAALPRTTASRDMFRDGIQFTLVKIIPPPLPPPPEEPEEEKKPAKKGKGTTPPAPEPEPDPDAPPPPPPPEPTRIVMGTAQWKPTALLDGETIKAQTVVSFKPPPELFNAKGIMTPLKGQDMESTGTARITFTLHVPEPPKKEEPEAEIKAPEKVPEKEKPSSRGKGSAKSKR
ncbi:hypothetical protein CYMTET_54980 [Cymbomonas tetramitiformis]|uniref:Uncharacterized protein n=1 Tax=Cymbomonas tetramitiformis TaxID=36881 RepID=A0AAE0ENT5_9CHLO|nr:hypothetical protein CYMTET_54980 [Cymbomonas tetramitiformis]